MCPVENKQSDFEKFEELKTLVEKNRKLQCSKDYEYLLQSLKGSNFVVKDAYKQLKWLHKLKKDFPDYFTNFKDPDFLKFASTSKAITLLRGKTDDGCGVIFIKPENWDWHAYGNKYYVKLLVLACLVAAKDPEILKNGVHILVDAKGISASYVRAIGIKNALFSTRYAELAMSVKMKQVHIFNHTRKENFWVKVLASFSSSTGKVRRYKSYGKNYEPLYQVFPKEILPEEYGGEAGPLENQSVLDRIDDL